VADHLGDSHVSDVLGPNDAVLMSFLHPLTAKSGESGSRDRFPQGMDQLCAIGIAGGLAGREKDARIG
jgi:hypothetical protein